MSYTFCCLVHCALEVLCLVSCIQTTAETVCSRFIHTLNEAENLLCCIIHSTFHQLKPCTFVALYHVPFVTLCRLPFAAYAYTLLPFLCTPFLLYALYSVALCPVLFCCLLYESVDIHKFNRFLALDIVPFASFCPVPFHYVPCTLSPYLFYSVLHYAMYPVALCSEGKQLYKFTFPSISLNFF